MASPRMYPFRMYRVMERLKGSQNDEGWQLSPSYRRGKAVYLVASAAKNVKTRNENRYPHLEFRVEVTEAEWSPLDD